MSCNKRLFYTRSEAMKAKKKVSRDHGKQFSVCDYSAAKKDLEVASTDWLPSVANPRHSIFTDAPAPIVVEQGSMFEVAK